jgi:hypothetical protein
MVDRASTAREVGGELIQHVLGDAAELEPAAEQPSPEVTDRHRVLKDGQPREARDPELLREVLEVCLSASAPTAVLQHKAVTVLQSHEKTSSPGQPIVGMTTGAGEEVTVMRSKGPGRCWTPAGTGHQLCIRINSA